MAKTESIIGWALKETMQKSAKEMAEKCRARANEFTLIAGHLTRAAVHFEQNEFRSGFLELGMAKATLE